jgi:hypothetical protein
MADAAAWLLLAGVNDEVTYNWFHNGAGTGTIDANADGWRELRDAYQEALELVDRALVESGASWSGAAADGAHGAVSPMRVWVERAMEAAVTSAGAVGEQSAMFSDIKGRLSPPVVVPEKPWFADMWPGATNYDEAVRAKQANSIRNLELAWRYGDITEANNAVYPQFEVPVEIGTDVSRQAVQPGEPVPSRAPGIVERGTGPRQPGRPEERGGPPSQPSIVDEQPRPDGQTWQPVDPNQFVPSGPTPASPVLGPAVPGPGSVRGPLTIVPVAGPGSGGGGDLPEGGRAQGERVRQPRPIAGAPGSPGAPGEPVRGTRVTSAAGGAGHPGGFVPGAGRAAGDEDKEHKNKFGPVGWHEEFWEDGVPSVVEQPIGGHEDK